MCGIAGYYSSKLIYEEFLSHSINILNHRGPDDSGLFFSRNNNVGLGHTRLSIQDISSNGAQPMTSKDGKVSIVYNGEIYNQHQLRSKLESKGYFFKGKSDTEVLLALYLESKRDMKSISKFLNRLNGIFAFAIWDETINSLWLCRDRFGVKPLYFINENNNLFFSSESKIFNNFTVLEKSDKQSVLNNLDINSIILYLSYTWCPGDTTPSSKISKLNPGEIFRIEDGKITEQKKWGLQPYEYQYQKKNKLSLKRILNSFSGASNNLIDQLDNELRNAVKNQMLSDVEVGAFLSGGLDSSCLVNYAKDFNPNIKCFTISTKNAENDGFANDLYYARKVAKHLNINLQEVSITPDDFINNLPAMISQLDEPLADPAALNTFFISKIAKEQNIKVLLSGTGGDDIFSGYRRHQAIYLNNLGKFIPRGLWHYSYLLLNNLNKHSPVVRRLTKFTYSQQLPANMRIANLLQKYPIKNVTKLLSPEAINYLKSSKFKDPIQDYLESLSSNLDDMSKCLALEQRFYLPDLNFNYMDKMSMANGVEVRVPFLDKELVEFVYKLPTEFKQRFLTSKWILKKMMEKYLPREIIYRPKTGFQVPFASWLRNELKDYTDEILSYRNIEKRKNVCT